MLLTSDWHLKPESADTVFAVIDALEDAAVAQGEGVICHLGDLYHLRYQIPASLQNRLVERLVRSKVRWLLMPGNHDQYDVEGRNALEILGYLPGVDVVSDVSVVEIDGHPVAVLPYRKDVQDYVPFLENLAGAWPSTAFVHHGLVGASMNNGVLAGVGDGIPREWLSSFDQVFFGHWHKHQIVGNCAYVGSPWQTRADEAGDAKGYIIAKPGEAFAFHELRIGRRFHRGLSSDSDPGDLVRAADTKDNRAAAEELRSRGVEVILESAPEKAKIRVGKVGASMREYAEHYVAEHAGDLDAGALLQTFDDVVAS